MRPFRLLRRPRERGQGLLDRRRFRRARHGASQHTRLFEVVRNDLDVFVPTAGKSVGPVGKELVQVRAAALRELVVGDVPDQDVLEGVLPLAGDRRARPGSHEVAPLERVEARGKIAPRTVQARKRARPEHRADHRSVLCHTLFVRRKLVEAGRDQRLEAARDRQLLPVPFCAGLGEHAHGLLDEERVAARIPEHGLERRSGEAGRGGELFEELRALALAECLQLERDAEIGGCEEERPDVLHLGPRRADQQDRCPGLALGDELEQVEERRLGPVQILEDEHERATLGQELEQAADAPVELGLSDLGRGVRSGRSRGDADDVRHGGRDRPQLVEVVTVQRLDQRAELRRGGSCVVVMPNSRRVFDDLGHGPVRDSLAVGEASPPVHVDLLLAARGDLGQQAALPDAWLTDHGRKSRALGRDH
jgi:hypothetical protein